MMLLATHNVNDDIKSTYHTITTTTAPAYDNYSLSSNQNKIKYICRVFLYNIPARFDDN
jgi:hypothetical protein